MTTEAPPLSARAEETFARLGLVSRREMKHHDEEVATKTLIKLGARMLVANLVWLWLQRRTRDRKAS